MPQRAHSSFTIDSTTDSPMDWTGGSMNRSRWAETFTGDLSGASVAELTMGTLDTGARVYVGVERFDCQLSGRKGTFVVAHSATMLGSDYNMVVQIVPGSGTDELQGITGSAEITPGRGACRCRAGTRAGCRGPGHRRRGGRGEDR